MHVLPQYAKINDKTYFEALHRHVTVIIRPLDIFIYSCFNEMIKLLKNYNKLFYNYQYINLTEDFIKLTCSTVTANPTCRAVTTSSRITCTTILTVTCSITFVSIEIGTTTYSNKTPDYFTIYNIYT